MDNVARQIDEQARRERSQAAVEQLKSARTALEKARQEHGRGDSSYAAYLDTSQVALASATKVIDVALRSAATSRRLTAISSVMALFGLCGIGWGLNRRRAKAKNECLDLLKTWETGLGEKNVALFELLDRTSTVVGASSDKAAQRYAGETRKLSDQIIKDVDELFIMSACTGRVLRDAQAFAYPAGALQRCQNLFGTRRYAAALNLLRDQPIAFRPDEALELIVRGPKTERDTLLGHLESYKPFTMSFNQLIDEFNQRAARALASIELVESSLINVGKTLEAIQATIDMVRGQEIDLSDAAQADGLFRIPLVFEQLLPAAQTAQAEAVKIAIKDPVGALKTFGPEAQQRAADALALAKVISDFRADNLPSVRQMAGTLSDAGLSCQWIDQELERLSAQADELAQRAMKESTLTGLQLWKESLVKLGERVALITKLDDVRRNTAQKSIYNAATTIDTARHELGRALAKEPNRMLRESAADPSDPVRQASEEIRTLKTFLERGDSENAQKSLDIIATLTAQAVEIVSASRKAFSDHEGTVAQRRTETERITGLLPQYEAILADIVHKYAPPVLGLGEGDPSHPNANGTIRDNMEEAKEHLAVARDLLAKSSQVFREAKLLESAELLRQIKERQETALFRLQEIAERQKRLAETEGANARCLGQLEARLKECAPAVADARTMTPTMQAYDHACRLVAAARSGLASRQCDPFRSAHELAAARATLEDVAQRVQCDHALFAEAERSLHSAAAQLDAARRLAHEASTDNVGDSLEISQAAREIESLMARLGRGREELDRAHGDWSALDTEADRIATDASRHVATLRKELQEAEAAVAAVSASANAVRIASAWSGSFGVVICGAPGSDYLAQARDLLLRGSYAAARNAAENARRAATAAVAEAEAQVRRLRRAEEERIERERRRRREEEAARQRRHSSSSWGGSGFGGSRSTFSNGSGVSRSSFSSGSGVSRSGW
ncbi:MAG: hypothetical protein FJ403_03460 [Verrucomicrobia bacterium]|nr:hypothetical protein [Verrucomicrobiota bacterium]